MTGRRSHGVTRRSILDALRRSGSLSAHELASVAGVGSVAIRQHLAQLQREGLVRQCGLRRSAGRPRQLYTLTQEAERSFPHSYEHFALDLLLCVGQTGGTEVDHLFAARQQLLAQRYQARLHGLALEDRVVALVELLTEQGYMAEHVHLEEGAIELVQHNCPIAQVAQRYDQACRCERALYEQLLEVTVVSEGTIAEGSRCCRYRIVH